MIGLQRLTGMRPQEVCLLRTCDLDMSRPVWVYTPREHKTEHHGRDRRVYFGPRAQEVVRPWIRTETAEYLFSPREAMDQRQGQRRLERRTPLTPSQRARKRKRRPKRAPRDRYDTRAYAHAVAAGCRGAFPHPTLRPPSRVSAEGRTAAEIKGLKEQRALSPAQAEELRDWQRKHHFHPNQLRHNAGTRLRREFGLDVARAVLGHSSPVVTEVYAELDEAKAAEAMARVG
jgi:integrase